jgi:hypothetical protein
MRRSLAAFALTLAIATPVMAGDFEVGLEAFDKKNYVQAHMSWIPAAVHGNAMAQFNLGVMCLEGMGAAPNPVQGLAWISMAADTMPEGENRKMAVNLRDKLSATLTPDEVKQANELKQQWGKEHKEALKGEADGASMQAPVEAAPLPGQLSMPTPIPGKPVSEQPQIDFNKKPAGNEAPKDAAPAVGK